MTTHPSTSVTSCATGVLALVLLAGCAAQTPAPPANAPKPFAAAARTAADINAVVGAADRSEADRALDAGRRPAELLQFLGIQPGMRVADLGAGTGYTTELLARAVGPTGTVYGQNTRFILERFAEKPWSERLTKPVMSNVVRVDREFDDPLPPEARDLDAVVLVLFYHDTVWMKTDRERMNRAIFAALRPGGVYVVIDHSARPGDRVSQAETLHRIEEHIVHDELAAAGFRFARSATFLRNPEDTRDWNAAPRAAEERRRTSDRFALLFRKP